MRRGNSRQCLVCGIGAVHVAMVASIVVSLVMHSTSLPWIVLGEAAFLAVHVGCTWHTARQRRRKQLELYGVYWHMDESHSEASDVYDEFTTQ